MIPLIFVVGHPSLIMSAIVRHSLVPVNFCFCRFWITISPSMACLSPPFSIQSFKSFVLVALSDHILAM